MYSPLYTCQTRHTAITALCIPDIPVTQQSQPSVYLLYPSHSNHSTLYTCYTRHTELTALCTCHTRRTALTALTALCVPVILGTCTALCIPAIPGTQQSQPFVYLSYPAHNTHSPLCTCHTRHTAVTALCITVIPGACTALCITVIPGTCHVQPSV